MRKSFLHLIFALAAILGAAAPALAAEIKPVPYRVAAKLPDVAEPLSPVAVHIDGWLGERIAVNEKNRLLQVDTEPLLAGFRKKPGTHPWIGEHIGKWLHAATLAWAYTGDAALREKINRNAAELIKCQEPDGYLGTYVPEKRFGLYKGADWDVWSHKYNLIGLLTYYQYTGNEAALAACRKMVDLLINTFPSKKSILAAGTHDGMAATSVLEPVVLLYRFTGDERYLDFARYIVKAWDEQNGPKIIATLLAEKRVDKTANAKAYEMLSNLVGLCELARATSDRALLEPVLNAWNDIATRRLYLTGSASYMEHFHDDYDLPNDPGSRVGETCVTTTWIQLNLQLLRLTGEAKYGNELERSFYNHLAAAQKPSGDDWCYYTALEGKKPYDAGITCCHSSGPRGMALAPLTAYLKMNDKGSDVLLIDTLESSRAKLELGGRAVTIEQQSGFPRQGRSEVVIATALSSRPAPRFAVKVRVPEWAGKFSVRAGGQAAEVRDGWAVLDGREWKGGARIEIDFDLNPRLIKGEHGNAGRAALAWGPFVLAYDQADNPGLPAPMMLGLTDAHPPCTLQDGPKLAFKAKIAARHGSKTLDASFTTFADAGATGGTYRVWLRAPGVEAVDSDSLLITGQESRSRKGNLSGSIIDGDPQSCVVTWNGKKKSEDWYAVALDAPTTIGRVVFMHGKDFNNGGWFDASAGKPQIQIQDKKAGEWKTLSGLKDYPQTSATDKAGLKPGQAFTFKFEKPVQAVGVRVIGKPACGDDARQAFSSCAELQAFAK